MTVSFLNNGRVNGILISNTIHVLGYSSSSYGIRTPDGSRHQYVCQDGCCDSGLRPDVEALVERAKAMGAQKVVVRTGQRKYYCDSIAGLPVEDVSGHVGSPAEGYTIGRG